MAQAHHTLPIAPRAAISWWLAAGIVGADIGTSVFYSTGILFALVGFAAPWFVLFVVGAMWLFKLTYQEGCSVNPLNGGAYSMALSTMGRRTALVIGSLIILTYLATAVVSALSGAYYLSSLWGGGWPAWKIFAVAAIPIVGFALLNLRGIKESAKLVFVIAAIHFTILLVMDAWGLYLAFTQGAEWSRLWHGLGSLTPHAFLLGFAAAFLGITGFESAAQIVEEIEEPVSRSIRRIYLAIVLLVSITAPLSAALSLVLMSEEQIAAYRNNMLSGLAMVEGGQIGLTILVLNAVFVLFAAVNTAYVAATGLMTTMSHQGNLPSVVLKRWVEKNPRLQGYPYVALPFMLVCLAMLAVFPGAVDRLGEIYGMAFLGVMIAYSAGVILMRLHHPAKVARSEYLNAWVLRWRERALPVPPMLGLILLVVAETVLLLTSTEARDLGAQLFLVVLLVMAFYRLGQVEGRMVQLPDLRLGMGKLKGLRDLPEELPRLVVCVAEIDPVRLVNLLTYLLKKHAAAGPIEIVLFHAQTKDEPLELFEEVQRLISQQLEEFPLFAQKDFILTVKILPGNLLEVLPEYFKIHPFTTAYVGTGHDPLQSERLREHLSNEIDLNVMRIDEALLPKGPGVWFEQWLQERDSSD
jgi:amino acid transporter